MKTRVRKVLQFMTVFFAFLSFLFVGVYLSRSSVSSRFTVTASAEESTQEGTTRSASDIDLTKYPSANLIPYPYFEGPSHTEYGITFTSNSDGSITVNGTATGQAQFILIEANKIFNYTGTFTVSLTGSTDVFLVTGGGTSGLPFSPDPRTYTFSSSMNWGNFILQVNSGTVLSNVTVFPMLNAGSTSYPYQPYLPYLLSQAEEDGYNSGHEAGYQEGETAGYNEGYQEGYDVAGDTLSLGIFKSATFSASLTYDDESTLSVSSFTPSFIYSGVSTSSFWSAYQSKPSVSDVYLQTCDLTVHFSEPFSYATFPLYFSGDSVVTSGYFTTASNTRVSFTITPWEDSTESFRDYYKLVASGFSSDFLISSVTIRFGRASDTLEHAFLVTVSGEYNYVYDKGFNEGKQEGITEGQQEGYEQGKEDGITEGITQGKEQGYDLGYSVGHQDGYNEGISSDVSAFDFINSIITAPVDAVLSMFDVDFMGWNLKGLLGFIVCGAIIVIVLKIVL